MEKDKNHRKTKSRPRDRQRPSPSSSSCSSDSSTSSSSSSCSEKKRNHREEKDFKKKLKIEKKEQKVKDKLLRREAKKKIKEAKHYERKQRKEEKRARHFSKGADIPDPNPDCGPSIELMNTKALAPETKEEWEARQKIIRRVQDPETGRVRLIKGDGEVLEECVSHDRHKEINRQATEGDGVFFQSRTIGWDI